MYYNNATRTFYLGLLYFETSLSPFKITHLVSAHIKYTFEFEIFEYFDIHFSTSTIIMLNLTVFHNMFGLCCWLYRLVVDQGTESTDSKNT